MAEAEIIEPKKDYLASLEDHDDGVSEGMAIVNTAEVNQQISTAHRYPRSVTAFRRKVYEMVTLDIETAESCIYAIPRDGKMIDGPSIRFAEILLVGWGNYRAATEVTDIGERFITAEGVFFDLETNGAIKAKTMRRIVGKSTPQFPNGKRFGDDMIATTGNAAASIALRNAVTRGIPKALWKELFDEAKKVAGGSAKTFGERRDKVIKELGIQGATPDQIFALLGVKGQEDLQTEHLVHLRGLQNAIKDGETTVEDAFGPQSKPGQVIPPQPSRSDFERGTGAKTGETKTKPAAAQPQADKPKPADPGPKVDPAPEAGQDATHPEQVASTEPAKEDQAAARAKALADEMDDWYADMKKELASHTKAGTAAAFRDQVAAQLDGERLAEWDELCSAKIKAILDATRKPKGGGK